MEFEKLSNTFKGLGDLTRLKSSEFVKETRRGQWVFYSLNKEKLELVGPALLRLPDESDHFREVDVQVLSDCVV
jgi:ArsR family transcriptional regulator, arsenate/arsenite/antimonite-responsive transcriptional repressor